LRTVGSDGFVRVAFDRVLALLEMDGNDDDSVKAGLEAAKVDSTVTARPSVETVLHALALQLEAVSFVGHTHPTAVNAVTCSHAFEEAVSGRLFPDEIVVCGPAPVVVPYTDPGLPLARKVRDLINQYVEDRREIPKAIMMQNHGFIALGRTALEVQGITAMAVKAARVLLGTYTLGGPHLLTPENVARIHTRPDEQYRRKKLGDP
jgi:rhamnose utilization protein RhaD (predicted bifunctional aldolase and dehydrogenase)